MSTQQLRYRPSPEQRLLTDTKATTWRSVASYIGHNRPVHQCYPPVFCRFRARNFSLAAAILSSLLACATASAAAAASASASISGILAAASVAVCEGSLPSIAAAAEASGAAAGVTAGLCLQVHAAEACNSTWDDEVCNRQRLERAEAAHLHVQV